jgi:hypothetical protein
MLTVIHIGFQLISHKIFAAVSRRQGLGAADGLGICSSLKFCLRFLFAPLLSAERRSATGGIKEAKTRNFSYDSKTAHGD